MLLSPPMDAERWRADERDLREAVRSLGATQEHPIRWLRPSRRVAGLCHRGVLELRGRPWRLPGSAPCAGLRQLRDHRRRRRLAGRHARGRRASRICRRRSEDRTQLPQPGLPAARNLGLEHAQGEIVAFIDADGFAAPSWLRELVAAFDADETIGGAASTVFFADNPLVLNGAGGIVNRQGWAADLSMNQSYERAELASEALTRWAAGWPCGGPRWTGSARSTTACSTTTTTSTTASGCGALAIGLWWHPMPGSTTASARPAASPHASGCSVSAIACGSCSSMRRCPRWPLGGA